MHRYNVNSHSLSFFILGVPLTSFASLRRSGRRAPGYAIASVLGFAVLSLRTALARALRMPHAQRAHT
ncbi:hypothetical protein [Thermaurantimonas sp.]|uniref:hypothetical protein n=1 Tax=Thermaurantimonas sp. TaxID=2681568 RepID=UPI00391D4392